MLHALLAEGRARAKRNYLLRADDPVHVWLRELDAMVTRPGAAPPATSPGTPVFISTAEAAALIGGISPRAMLNHRTTIHNRKIGNSRQWLLADVLAEADARSCPTEGNGTNGDR